jgi:hypothetical protein
VARIVTLSHPHETFQVSRGLLFQKCGLLSDNLTPAGFPSFPKPQSALADFKEFHMALDGKAVMINNNNFNGLSHLYDEFLFHDSAV